MPQATQMRLPFENESKQTDNGFYDALNFSTKDTNTQFGKGRLFERLVRAYLHQHVRLNGIPEDAYRYVVNGRSPIEWFIDRYYIRTDKDSGIVNDPNGWFADPRDLVSAIKRIVYVSVESARIVDGLPGEKLRPSCLLSLAKLLT